MNGFTAQCKSLVTPEQPSSSLLSNSKKLYSVHSAQKWLPRHLAVFTVDCYTCLAIFMLSRERPTLHIESRQRILLLVQIAMCLRDSIQNCLPFKIDI